jgi:hypothetical protein
MPPLPEPKDHQKWQTSPPRWQISRTICVKDAARDLVKGQEHQCQG